MTRLADRSALWLGLFALYAVAAGAVRLAMTETVAGDTAESFLWSLDLAWGYGAQPPLYAWIQHAVNAIFGPTLLSSVVMRGLCHFAIPAGAFALARAFVPVRLAGLAALGVFLVPEVAQTFLRTRTHNMLAAALAPWVALAFLRLAARGRRRDHALFGAVAALGILAKATLAVLPLALLLAALAGRERRRLTPAGIGWAIVAAAAVLAGPAWWLWQNAGIGTASLAKLAPGEGGGGGLARLARSLVDAWGPAAALVLAALVATRAPRAPAPPGMALMARAAVAALLLVAAGVLAAGAGEIKERWLVPIFLPFVPVALAAVMRRRGPLRLLPAAAGGLAAVWMVAALPGYFRDLDPPPLAAYRAQAAALAGLGAERILAPKDLAAALIQIDPDLPVRARVDGMQVPCGGRLALVAEVPRAPEADAFTARLRACRAVPAGEATVPGGPGRPALAVALVDLVPAR